MFTYRRERITHGKRPGTYHVESRSQVGLWHRADTRTLRCTCPAGMAGRRCWHLAYACEYDRWLRGRIRWQRTRRHWRKMYGHTVESRDAITDVVITVVFTPCQPVGLTEVTITPAPADADHPRFLELVDGCIARLQVFRAGYAEAWSEDAQLCLPDGERRAAEPEPAMAPGLCLRPGCPFPATAGQDFCAGCLDEMAGAEGEHEDGDAAHQDDAPEHAYDQAWERDEGRAPEADADAIPY